MGTSADSEKKRFNTRSLDAYTVELNSAIDAQRSINSELRKKLEEVSRTNSDLENLMNATKISILLLDRDLKIERFTPGMESLFNIRSSDRNRPISDFTHKLEYPELTEDASRVLDELLTLERETTTSDGDWFLIRLRPYRNAYGQVTGVVISFVNITDFKKTRISHQNFQSFYTLFHANPIPTLLTRLEDEVVINANQALLDYLGLRREQVIGHTGQEFNLGLNLQSEQRSALTTQLLKDGAVRNFEEEIRLPSGEVKTVLTSIQYIFIENQDAVITTFIDITDRVQAEQQVRRLSIDLTNAEQEERYRISQVLHDDLQQRIFAIKMHLENLAEAFENNELDNVQGNFAKLEEWLLEAINLTRQLSTDLSPLTLKGEELPEVLLWLASHMREQYGLEVEVDFKGEQIELANNLVSLLFHSVRELLFNVVKHSNTLKARVGIERIGQDLIRVTVSDEGSGFDSEAIQRNEIQAHGLTTLRQRLALFDCNLKIESGQNHGTRVTIDCPIKNLGK